jgi:predicted DNA-binding protein
MNDHIIFKLSTELKEQLKQEAKERELTLSAYIKAIIAERKK